MRVLLVGARSALAQDLSPQLAGFAEVLAAGRSGCTFALDLTWPAERIVLPAGVDAVVQLAAHFGGVDPEAIRAAEETNALGTLKLAQACVRAGVGHLVLISSLSAALDTHSPYYGIYALSKRHGEELARLQCGLSGLPLTILRPAQIYGDSDAYRPHQPLLYTAMDRAERGEEIVLFGAHDARRNYVHGEDVARVVAALVRDRVEGSFDCVGEAPVRLSELAAAAVAAFGSASTIRFDAARADVPDNVFARDEALYRRIGFAPEITLAQGLARLAARRRSAP
jgi:nucleoside-diphosphate-sugar epimerase